MERVEVSTFTRAPRRENCLERRIRKIVKWRIDYEKAMDADIPGLNNIFDRRKKLWFRFLWFLIFALCFLTCFYQCLVRLEYFNSFPVTVDMLLIQNETLFFPGMSMCHLQTHAVVEKYLQFTMAGTYHAACVGFQSLYELSVVPELTLDELWNLSNPFVELSSLRAPLTSMDAFDSFEEMLKYANLENTTDLTIKIIDIPMGRCFICRYNKPVKFEGGHKTYISIETKKAHPKSCRRFPILFGSQQAMNVIDPATLGLTSQNMHSSFTLYQKKYKFINRPKARCTDDNVYNDCLDKCQQRRYDELSAHCRFPFMKNKTKPMCKTGPVTQSILYDMWLEFATTNAVAHCKCLKKCEQTNFDFSQQMIDPETETTLLKFSVLDNSYVQIQERRLYDVVALLCDVGGNLGLYLGLSLLSTFNQITEVIKFVRRKKLYTIRDPINRKIKLLYDEQLRKNLAASYKLGFSFTKITSYFRRDLYKFIIWTFCFIVCLIFVSLRLHLYLQNPTNRSVTMILDKYVDFPIIRVCGDSSDIGSKLARLVNYLNVTSECQLNFLNLFDFKGATPELVWKVTSIAKEYKSMNQVCWFSVIFLKKFKM